MSVMQSVMQNVIFKISFMWVSPTAMMRRIRIGSMVVVVGIGLRMKGIYFCLMDYNAVE